MSHFIFPQPWITAAIAAAAVHFGPLPEVDTVHIKYRNLPAGTAGSIDPPDRILIDKRPEREWPKAKAQCVMIHEYGHLSGRIKHSKNPNSIMYHKILPKKCNRWLHRHHVK